MTVTTQGTAIADCTYLHSAFGPGCPYCPGVNATARALAVKVRLPAGDVRRLS